MTTGIDAMDSPDIDVPHNLEAEQSLLGAMLQSRSAISDTSEMIRADDFLRPAHQRIYEAIMELYGRGHGVDPVTVYGLLDTKGLAGRVGGALYLHEMVAMCPTTVNATYYADIVTEKARLRRLAESGERAIQRARNPSGASSEELIADAQAELAAITVRSRAEDFQPIGQIMPGAVDEIEAIAGRGGKLTGVPTGIADLDQLTNGLHPGQMIVVAARPAVGKSVLGMDFLRSAALRHGIPSIMFNLEMNRNELTRRLLSAEARIPLHHIQTGMLSDDDWTKLARTMAEVSEAPLFIDDSPNMLMGQIEAKCERMKDQHGLGFVVIDYLQLMKGPNPNRSESRQNDVSEISRSIKLLAKKFEVPVVAISQLNRGPEQRQDGRPQLSDLRESGSIEQDADMVILLHRPDYKEREHPRAGEADIIVAKHRNGPTTTLTVAFQGHYSRFVDMYQPPANNN